MSVINLTNPDELTIKFRVLKVSRYFNKETCSHCGDEVSSFRLLEVEAFKTDTKSNKPLIYCESCYTIVRMRNLEGNN